MTGFRRGATGSLGWADPFTADFRIARVFVGIRGKGQSHVYWSPGHFAREYAPMVTNPWGQFMSRRLLCVPRRPRSPRLFLSATRLLQLEHPCRRNHGIMKIRVDDLLGPEIAGLLEEHIRDMRAISPPGKQTRPGSRGVAKT